MRFLEISNEFQRAGIENSNQGLKIQKQGLKIQKQGLKIQKQGLKVKGTNDIPEKHEVAISEVQGREAGVEKSKAVG